SRFDSRLQIRGGSLPIGSSRDLDNRPCWEHPAMFASLKGHVAVITGASKGIGRGIAKRFAEVGCSVCVVARGTGDAEKVVREISDAGGTASGFSADVSDAASMRVMAAAVTEKYRRIDIVCANAGIFPAAKLDAMTVEDFDQVTATNLRGTFLAL